MKKLTIISITLLTIIGTFIAPISIYAEDEEPSEPIQDQEPGEIQDEEEAMDDEEDILQDPEIEQNNPEINEEIPEEENLLASEEEDSDEEEQEPNMELALIFVALMFIPFLVAMLR